MIVRTLIVIRARLKTLRCITGIPVIARAIMRTIGIMACGIIGHAFVCTRSTLVNVKTSISGSLISRRADAFVSAGRVCAHALSEFVARVRTFVALVNINAFIRIIRVIPPSGSARARVLSDQVRALGTIAAFVGIALVNIFAVRSVSAVSLITLTGKIVIAIFHYYICTLGVRIAIVTARGAFVKVNALAFRVFHVPDLAVTPPALFFIHAIISSRRLFIRIMAVVCMLRALVHVNAKCGILWVYLPKTGALAFVTSWWVIHTSTSSTNVGGVALVNILTEAFGIGRISRLAVARVRTWVIITLLIFFFRYTLVTNIGVIALIVIFA
jgi:hypothetical protein